jgi:hypothetical protein
VTGHARRAAILQRLNQRIGGQLAVLVVLVDVTLVGFEYMALVVRYPSSVCLVGPFDAPTVPGS